VIRDGAGSPVIIEISELDKDMTFDSLA